MSDFLCSLVGLVAFSPLMLLIALWIWIREGRPVLFRQRRVGLDGATFDLLKFRSMRLHAEGSGPLVTAAGDARITPIGRVLRNTKLDELPQLWNVLRGEMSLVGPRPEVPYYVQKYTLAQREVLKLKPGLTDLATLEFCNEEELLKSARDTEQFYLNYCVPRKIELNLAYARRANLWQDAKLLGKTIWVLLTGSPHKSLNA